MELNGKYGLPQGELWGNYSTGRKQDVQRPGRGRQRENSVPLVTLKKRGERMVRG